MKILFIISALCLQLQWCYGKPEGVGAYAYQDSTGNRYGGTYGLKDGQAFDFKNTGDETNFQPNPFVGFPDLDSFFPEYFRNFDNLIQENHIGTSSVTQTYTRRSGGFGSSRRSSGVKPKFNRRAFRKNAEQQEKALNAARKAFDLTSNQIGYVPNFDIDFNRFSGFPGFGFPRSGMGMPMPGFGNLGTPFVQPYGANSAFAGGAVGPGYRHQVLAFNPTDPSMPNVDVTQFSDDTATRRSPGFYSVQSSSFATSANLNGKQINHKGGQTVVNDNGLVTKYSLNN